MAKLSSCFRQWYLWFIGVDTAHTFKKPTTSHFIQSKRVFVVPWCTMYCVSVVIRKDTWLNIEYLGGILFKCKTRVENGILLLLHWTTERTNVSASQKRTIRLPIGYNGCFRDDTIEWVNFQPLKNSDVCLIMLYVWLWRPFSSIWYWIVLL